MSQFWFFLGFLSQNSLQKLSIFRAYKGIYSRVFMSRELIDRPDYQFLSYSAPTIVTLQFLACFTRVAFWQGASRESLVRSSCENPLNPHTLEFFTLFSHTTLTLFLPKYRVSNC